eukprot:8113683-Alexandrium_andersonii.AAC.1
MAPSALASPRLRLPPAAAAFLEGSASPASTPRAAMKSQKARRFGPVLKKLDTGSFIGRTCQRA